MEMEPESLSALSNALRCELRARAIYKAALNRFGAVEPFVHLAEAVEREIAALRQLHERHRSEPPSDRWNGRIELPRTLEQAGHEALDAETATVDACRRLLDEENDPVVRMILSRLEEASRYQRLPILRRSMEHEKA